MSKFYIPIFVFLFFEYFPLLPYDIDPTTNFSSYFYTVIYHIYKSSIYTRPEARPDPAPVFWVEPYSEGTLQLYVM